MIATFQSKAIIVIKHKVLSHSAGVQLKRVRVECLFCASVPLRSLNPVLYSLLCVQYVGLSAVGATISLDQIQTSFTFNPPNSLTAPTNACSSPPTSVFNQLVLFISGNIEGKRVWLREFDFQPGAWAKARLHWQDNRPSTANLFSGPLLYFFCRLVLLVSLITGILFICWPKEMKEWRLKPYVGDWNSEPQKSNL